MKLPSKELKRRARESLNGRYGIPMSAYVATEAIILGLTLPFDISYYRNPIQLQSALSMIAQIIISLLSVVLSCGLLKIHLKLAREEKPVFSDVFFFFSNRPDRLILAQLLLLGISILVMLPFFITLSLTVIQNSAAWQFTLILATVLTCGVLVYISLAYNLVYCILIDNPDFTVTEAYRKSSQLMRGNKRRLLYIHFSFIGLLLLCLLSCGIGLLWVAPYITQTSVQFYRNVIGEIY